MCDIAALVAPRPLIIETGLRDSLNGKSGIKNVTSQYEITKKAYEISGYTDRLMHTTFDAGHIWSGEEVYPFFKKYL
jgi:hypothetical protein